MSKRTILDCQLSRAFNLALPALFLLILAAAAAAQPPGAVRVTIDPYHDADLGEYVDVTVSFVNDSSDLLLGGFDLLIEYDTAVVDFYQAYAGLLLTSCNWEVFEPQEIAPGLVQIVALADGAGPEQPTCHLEGDSGILAWLKFHITDDSAYVCGEAHLQFYWTECGSNVFSSETGSELYLSNRVFDWTHYLQINEDDTLPTYKGAPDSCADEGTVMRMVDFYNGRIDIDCGPPEYFRGDINLNFIANEIADWVLFGSYFLEGDTVFVVDREAQIAVSDVNADSAVLTLPDLIYLYRIIIGDAWPYPKTGRRQPTDTACFTQVMQDRQVTVTYSDSLAAAYLIFSGEVHPELWIIGPSISYSYRWDTTYVLIQPTDGGKPAFGTTILISYIGNGQLLSAEVGDWHDSQIPTSVEVIEPAYVELDLPDMVWKLPDSAEQLPVYVTTPEHPIGGFMVQITQGNPSVIKFDTLNPVAYWGEAVADWPILTFNDMGTNGGILRLTGFQKWVEPPFADPIFPSPDSQLLFMLNTIRVDSMVDTLCSFTGRMFVSDADFADTFSLPNTLFWTADDCDYVLRCLLCGDVTGDFLVNVSDAVYLICWIFGVCEPPEYLDDCDVNCDDIVNISDAVYLISYIFAGGPAPCAECP